MPESTVSIPRHLYSLDALRGVAALAVVVFHWPHLFRHGTELDWFDVTRLPFFSVLKPFYFNGDRAVNLFFTLSGFIFYWLYSEKIARGAISLRQFAVLRLSRLYPLHLATLLIVAILQQWLRGRSGSYFVYPYNDPYHFCLQILFASSWGFEKGFSFNGPIWSVSVEVLLYGVFFLACLVKFRRAWQLGVLVLGGYFVTRQGHPLVGYGLFSFFVGGLSFYLFRYCLRKRLSSLSLIIAALLTIAMWKIVPAYLSSDTLQTFYKGRAWSTRLTFHSKDPVGLAIFILSKYSFELAVFPPTIIMLAIFESKGILSAARFSFLGQISYSAYLLHFPLQLIFVGATITMGFPQSIFFTRSAFLIFFAILIPLSLASFRLFEYPMQSWLRKTANRDTASSS